MGIINKIRALPDNLHRTQPAVFVSCHGRPTPDQRWTYTCEEVSGGTRYTQVIEGEPGGFFRLAGPLLERAIKRQFRADLETLKDLLEAKG